MPLIKPAEELTDQERLEVVSFPMHFGPQLATVLTLSSLMCIFGVLALIAKSCTG